MVDAKASSPSQPPSRGASPPPDSDKPPGSDKDTVPSAAQPLPAAPARKPEIGGPKGPEPTRYGDWEKGGRCIDF